jgi:hypothetical protein
MRTVNPVVELAEKIEALICEHPDPEEAETACSLAKELASLRAKRWLRPRVERLVNHGLQVQSASNRYTADGNPTLSN